MPDGRLRDESLAGAVDPAGSPEHNPRLEQVRIAEVAVLGRVGPRAIYSYRVPDRLASALTSGHLVQVPFGTRVLQGIALSVELGDGGTLRLRDVAEVLDPLPCLTQAQIDLAQWIAAYYMCSLGDALGVMLPAGLDRETVATYTLAPYDEHAPAHRLTEPQATMLELVRRRGTVTAAQVSGVRDQRRHAGVLENLARRDLLQKQVSLGRASVAERTELLVVLQPRDPSTRLNARQRTLIDYLAERNGEATWTDIRADLQIDRATLTQLTRRRLVLTYPRQVRRDPLAHRILKRSSPPRFSVEQAAVYGPISRALAAQDDSVFLLHGITGSGKTEVYLRAVADTLAAGREAIVLVPEIGLTPQAVERFAGRFPGQIALLHSRLNDGERYDEWQRIRRGECSVAIGPRSAVFSPFSRLGLIVIDEEHDPSYKQDTPAPRYHTRDVALRLARSCGATVILGSATPDVVSFFKARQGDYTLLEMTSRVHGTHAGDIRSREAPAMHPASNSALVQPNTRSSNRIAGLPDVQIVDMRLELKAGNRSIFSRALVRGLETALHRGEQAILFLNRRGNATFVNCRDCGRVVKCGHCDIPMTYHSHGDRLQCHRCDARAPIPTICAGCGSWRIRYFGLGTQKVEQEVQARFPNARVQRYDRDATAGKLGHEAILDRFASGDIDVLVGTQIVAKGLDFPRVTLVGAVSADTAINMPDFRAAERTFSILTQVAGRAGRAHLPGTVVVQSYAPTHFAIVAAAAHDYAAFYAEEIQARQDGLYPPFARLVRLTYADRVDERCRAEAVSLAESLQTWLESNTDAGIDIIGPAPCFTHKASDRYFWQILLRGQNPHPVLQQIPKGWSIDVDPMNLL